MMQTNLIDVRAPASPQALESLLVVNDGDTLDDVRVRVETALGLAEPMPTAALQRMLVDEEYFHSLLVARSAPAMLAHLLAKARPAGAEHEAAPTVSDGGHTAPQLVAKAASAFWQWSSGGFSRVEDELYEQRIAACLGCDQLSAAPDTMLHKVAGLLATDKRSCRACGCFVSAKARLPRENCPLGDSARPDLSRWGEPLRRRR